ncbi:MAG: alpha/beta fold hydrolase [Fidelibacterota bacterium]|nr:MAG: alpha/beta fold hydrolase [Candidatus Neomarinimicrobiota bacterium]
MSEIITERFSPHNIDLGDGPVGCFLIHGFTGSTYELQGLAEFLAANGFRVASRLLAGHGTSIEECNLVHAKDWLEESEFHFTEFALNCDATFVIGLSMGAGLALHLSTLFPVAGVVAMSPALILHSRYLRWYLPLITPFVSSISKERLNRGRDVDQHHYYGYSRYPLKGVRAMIKLNRYIRAELPKVALPAMIMHARNDPTAPFENATLVLNTIKSEDKVLRAYDHSGHVLPDSSEKEQVWNDTLDFLKQHLPD